MKLKKSQHCKLRNIPEIDQHVEKHNITMQYGVMCSSAYLDALGASKKPNNLTTKPPYHRLSIGPNSSNPGPCSILMICGAHQVDKLYSVFYNGCDQCSYLLGIEFFYNEPFVTLLHFFSLFLTDIHGLLEYTSLHHRCL